MEVFLFTFLALLLALVFCFLKKVCWYVVKLTALKSMLKDFNGANIEITFLRNLFAVLFGKKGEVDFTVKTKKERYTVSIISFLFTDCRWNIEKTRHNYYIEARYKDKFFYRVENNSGTEPEFAREYRREVRIQRRQLHLSSQREPSEKKILLIYPRPLTLTYASTSLQHLNAGDRIEDYEIMYADELLALLEKAEELA